MFVRIRSARPIAGLFFGIALLASTVGQAQAQNSLALSTSTPSVGIGQSVAVTLSMDFAEPTAGGGVTVIFGGGLVLNSISFDGSLGDDPDFRCPGSTVIACPAFPNYISFGTVAGLSGAAAVATLNFTRTSPATAAVTLASTSPFGGIGGDELAVSLSGVTVTSNMLLPTLSPWSSAALIGSLLLGAAVFARRSRSRSRTVGALVLLFALVVPLRGGAHDDDDADLDGVHDPLDNCINTINTDQWDSNVDGYGNMCDPDLDNDNSVDSSDLVLLKAVFLTPFSDADLDRSGTVDFLDLGRMAAFYGGAPGPSCPTCPLPQVCGDGIVQQPEECDDANLIDDDACTNACITGGCGIGTFDNTFDAIQTVVFDSPVYLCNNAACHGAAPGQGGLNLSSGVAYGELVGVPSLISPSTDRVWPGDHAISVLYDKLFAATNATATTFGGTPMPVAPTPLTADHLEAVRLWIRAGAPADLTVADTESLLGTCLPEPDPPVSPQPPPPGAGVGAQFVQTPWPMAPQSESEICMSTYYDLTGTGLIPASAQFVCGATTNNPSGICFRWHRQELTQDAKSHHSLVEVYDGSYDTTNPGWGSWTLKFQDTSDPQQGQPCDPLNTDPVLGYNPNCSGDPIPATACIGYGPPDSSILSMNGLSGAGEPYYESEFADGVYAVLPMQGITIWNSHAFNLAQSATTMSQYLNIEVAAPADQLFEAQSIIDASHIFIMNVPPFETREYCADYVVPSGANIFQITSHTHRHGVNFRIWEPPNSSCTAGESCPEGPPGQLIYTSTDYADPIQLTLDPPVLYNGNNQNRRFRYCSEYDNGAGPGSPEVKMNSNPLTSCSTSVRACMDGPNKGTLCGGNDAFCDSTPGAGDGSCDACPVVGGVTTEDEMFVFLATYY